MGRQTWIDLDVHQVYPILNLLFLGPSGVGKSSAIRIGFQLFEAGVNRPPTLIFDCASPEGLHATLVRSSHAVIFAEELATFFGKQRYMEGMLPYITNLLDYKAKVERLLKGEGLTTVERPEITFLGGSTTEWLQDEMPDTAVSGGFLPRFLLVKEDAKRQKISNPNVLIGRAQRTALDRFRSQVFREYTEIVNGVIEGPRGFHDYAVADLYDAWYVSHKAPTEALEPFAARAPVWVLRLALLSSICRQARDIEEHDIQFGVRLYEYTERKLAEALQIFTPKGRLLKAVLQAVPFEPISRRAIYRQLRSLATVKELRELLDSLTESGDVESLSDNRVRRVE